MDKHNLVILKTSDGLILDTDNLYINKFYRCLNPTEMESDEYLIHGNSFTQEEFDNLFELAHDRIIRDWTYLGLIVDGKMITKKKFNDMANVFQYTSGRGKKLTVAYFRRDNLLCGFYPMFREPKALSMKHAYDSFKRIFEGDMMPADNELVQFGDRGIPISYGNLRFWKTY